MRVLELVLELELEGALGPEVRCRVWNLGLPL
jgi:hypothetical protein